MKITNEHVHAIKQFGYTEREARFLYVVAIHSGYFTQNHVRQFSGNRSGRTVSAFIKRALSNEHLKESKHQNNARVISSLTGRFTRISGGMLSKIKFIAAYQTQPESAVTHYAPVSRIEPYGEQGKFKLIFAEPAKPIRPIPFADAPQGSMQGPRYTSFDKLMKAKKLTDLF